MKLKKGDKVVVVSGKNRGTVGEIMQAFPRTRQVIIAGVNVVKRHKKNRAGGAGAIVEKPMPIDVSNVMLVDAKSGKGTRVGITRKNGTRVRIAKKSGAEV